MVYCIQNPQIPNLNSLHHNGLFCVFPMHMHFFGVRCSLCFGCGATKALNYEVTSARANVRVARLFSKQMLSNNLCSASAKFPGSARARPTLRWKTASRLNSGHLTHTQFFHLL